MSEGQARGRVIFSHGLDSGPRANKIVALRPIADAGGWATEAVDDRDVNDDPVARIDRLVARIEADDRPTVLVGSSMGGFVSVMAAERVEVAGLFVMAPALYLEHRHPGAVTRERYSPKAGAIHVVHGWRDDVIPWSHGLKFAEQQKASIRLLDAGHRLESVIPELKRELEAFLGRVVSRGG
ncbi:YqiA/YcfP family alpha/beta fold hydrolase [Halomonas denitrificans]|nr:alpha/beta hydrolase [Halomonas denitrificans]